MDTSQKSHYNDILVGGFNPYEILWKSVGSIIPNWMERHKSHVPNHQPHDDDYYPIKLMIIIPLYLWYSII